MLVRLTYKNGDSLINYVPLSMPLEMFMTLVNNSQAVSHEIIRVLPHVG